MKWQSGKLQQGAFWSTLCCSAPPSVKDCMPQPLPVGLFRSCLSGREPPTYSHHSLPGKPTSVTDAMVPRCGHPISAREKSSSSAVRSPQRLSVGLHCSRTSPFARHCRSPSVPQALAPRAPLRSTISEHLRTCLYSSIRTCLLENPPGFCWVKKLGGCCCNQGEGSGKAMEGDLPHSLAWRQCCSYLRVTLLPHPCQDKSCTFHFACGAKCIRTSFLKHVVQVNRWLHTTWQTQLEDHFRASDLWNRICIGEVGPEVGPRSRTGVQGFIDEWAKTLSGWMRRERCGPLACQVRFHPRPHLPRRFLFSSFHSALSLHQVCRLISLWASFMAAHECPTSLTPGSLIVYKPDVPTELRASENLQNMSQSQNQRVGFSVSWANDDTCDRLVAHDLNFKSQINCASKDCIIDH